MTADKTSLHVRNLYTVYCTSGGSRICQKLADPGERRERAYNGSVGTEPPAGSRGTASAEDQGQRP